MTSPDEVAAYIKNSDERTLVRALVDGIRQYGRDARYAVPKDGTPLRRDVIPRMTDTFTVEFSVTMLLGHVGPMLATLDALRAERDVWRVRTEMCGVAELGVFNPNVASYCREWEARTEKAEAERDALLAERDAANRRVRWACEWVRRLSDQDGATLSLDADDWDDIKNLLTHSGKVAT